MQIKRIIEGGNTFTLEQLQKSVIILPDVPDRYELYAKDELIRIVELACSVRLKHLSEKVSDVDSPLKIYIGKTKEFYNNKDINLEDLGHDGYVIRKAGEKVFICGPERGSFFGVYDFCGIVFSYRYYAIGEEQVNRDIRYIIPEMDIAERPDIEARSLGFFETFKIENRECFENANRLWLGRNSYSDWILSGHTYFTILPKENYFDKHRDWYSPDGNNLCLSSEEMLGEFVKNLKEIIKTTDGCYVMIGQEDNFGFCECDLCRENAKKYGGESGLMMRFSNAVAREIKKWQQEECPGRKITLVTFAYNRTAPPPVKSEGGEVVPFCDEVVAEDNLAVMVVPFSAVYSKDLFDEQNSKNRDNFIGWSKVSKKLFVWSYCVNFDFYMINFNNFEAIGKTYRIFKELGVKFIFDQGPYNSRTPCFDELRMYLQSKLLWDTQKDTWEIIEEFMDNYYKDIAPFMKAYLNMIISRWNIIEEIHGEGARSGGSLSSYWLRQSFWPKWFLDACMENFREARGVLESLRVKEWNKYLILRERLKKQEISIKYLLLSLYGYSFGCELATSIDDLHRECGHFGITHFNEGGLNNIIFNF